MNGTSAVKKSAAAPQVQATPRAEHGRIAETRNLKKWRI
jgi:hypothetical protein